METKPLLKLAGCVIKNPENEILLLHRNTPKRAQWELPGGKIDPGEDPFITAKREVLEELGIEVEIEKEIGGKTFKEDGNEMEYTWFEAKIIHGEPKVLENKFDKFSYFSWEELNEMKEELSPNVQNLLDFHLSQ